MFKRVTRGYGITQPASMQRRPATAAAHGRRQAGRPKPPAPRRVKGMPPPR